MSASNTQQLQAILFCHFLFIKIHRETKNKFLWFGGLIEAIASIKCQEINQHMRLKQHLLHLLTTRQQRDLLFLATCVAP